MADPRAHWENVYATKAETAVSWYQKRPATSLAYIAEARTDRRAPIIDVGGGASTLADELLGLGYTDLTILDLAESALAKSRTRLGTQAERVKWITADVTRWKPARRYQIWHDRAVFHFLTDAERQDGYIGALQAGTLPGATVIMATFALEGPEKCSGLPVQRYSPETLAARIGPPFDLKGETSEAHITPAGAVQRFAYAVFRRD
jgi:hypothetical protein